MDSQFIAAKIMAANSAVRTAGSVQEILDNPDTLALMQQLLGPFVTQYSHSPIVGTLGGLLIFGLAHYGLTIPSGVSEILSAAVFAASSYAYQMFSMARAKKASLIQPKVTP